ncbi:M15 family metallopeptidase [Actinokineospora diospyrosa]|uniref:Uncharacterized protein n=1 Tax=Actinokineospora diospyrosa TaxID=103728 RepID=A0ABT1I5B9_9PSEU|nr:M15 family metallopeptidase [Actinokineospora diospyrosa]MCP2267819.1 hypothetical protein [Actinokineospora diospyrosa]
MTTLGRRGFLAGVGGVALTLSVGATEATAAPTEWRGRDSANGWPIRTRGMTEVRVEGSTATMTVLAGPAAILLAHVARRFHYEIAPLGPGDILGHTTDRRVGALQSNHLSGTAIAILPAAYPLSVAGGLYPHEIATIRDILADCSPAVRWGGDDPSAPQEGHFALDATPAAAAQAVRALVAAGTIPDPFTPLRRARALDLARRQRRR